jgi:hypothetical protein
MLKDLSASAVSAGALFANSRFEVPLYQREYSWAADEVKEFWDDLRHARLDESYFLGLIILTDSDKRFQVVDGQQRILTLTLLVIALRDEAKRFGRGALADKLQSDFLRAVNYQTDAIEPRVVLSGEGDSAALDAIAAGLPVDGALSQKIADSFGSLKSWLSQDVAPDPFRRLGEWASFITDRIYFAVFTHPDPASAYRVFEAINTRGRALTTADLLKNFILSVTHPGDQRSVYERWQQVAEQFDSDAGASFVQYIRHVVTVTAGHVLPKQLYDYLARRGAFSTANPPAPLDLLRQLEDKLPLYSQMIDPNVGGPADEELTKVFRAFNQLSVLTVRPLLLAIFEQSNALEASRDLLKLVVRRIVVGNLGTGNVERRFAEAAKRLRMTGDWLLVRRELNDLNPRREEFVAQIARRSFNKSVLAFLRESIVERTASPAGQGALHLIRVKNAPDWGGFDDDELRYWTNTIGNTLLKNGERRPREVVDWLSFKRVMLADAVDGERVAELSILDAWDAAAVEAEGRNVAELAADVWYAGN